MIKNNLVLVLSMLLTTMAFSQENVVKLGLGSAFQKDVNLKYERALGEHHSVQLSLIYDTPEKFGLGNVSGDFVAQSATLKGFVVAPEYRYYFGDKGAPRGFYAGVYGRYRTRSLSAVNDFGTEIEVDAELRLSNFGLGLGVGMQWLISDAFVIDWYIGGLGYNFFKLNSSITPTNPDDFNQLKGDLIEGINDWQLEDDAGQVVTDEDFEALKAESIKLIEATEVGTFKLGPFPFGLLDLRTGFSLGYAF